MLQKFKEFKGETQAQARANTHTRTHAFDNYRE